MAKGLHFFKFEPAKWLIGDIVFEPFEVQGLFINICAIYWERDGNLSIEDINKRFKEPTALHSLTDRFISVEDGLISIKFLDEQLQERGFISAINSTNGKLGGRRKANTDNSLSETKRPLTETKRTPSKLELELNKNKKNIFIPPAISEVVEYFISNGYSEQSAKKAFAHYERGNWHDTNGKRVLNWKQKMGTVWFKPENQTTLNNGKKYYIGSGLASNCYMTDEEYSICPNKSVFRLAQ